MFYNLLQYESNSLSINKTPYLKTILDDVQPDLFMVCELKSEAASNYMFTNAIQASNSNFQKAAYQNSQSPATDLLQMVYYNSEKLRIVNNQVISTRIRDINHYTFELKTANKTKIEVYVTHLKASRGQENREKRDDSAFSFVRDLERVDSNSFVIFAGDFNFYTSNEPGFQTIIKDTNPIQIIDPINRLCPEFPNDGRDYYDADYDNTYFWNNSSFADVHSQSTRSSSGSSGSGGGMDDRFDFIMLSKNFITSSEMYYVDDSYKTIGNNGNCYNSFVSNTSCTGEYSQNLRNALFNFSDHLPIVLEVEHQQNILNSSTYNYDKLNYSITDNRLNISANNQLQELKIYNILGQLILNQKNINSANTVINLDQLKKGVFILKADNFKPLKFIKN